jgi:malyl-CoA/(S)-citramalyl-CoA lyase
MMPTNMMQTNMTQTNSGQATRIPLRLLRSMLFVPATSERFFAKAVASDADGIIFDLEDSVAEGQKDQARKKLVSALNDLDFGAKTVAVRINGVDSRHMFKDVIALAEHCPQLHLIVQPMVDDARHVQFLSTLLDQLQGSKAGPQRIAIEAIIETPLGLEHLREIATSSPRLENLSFGAGDYAAAMHMKNHVVGAPDRSYRISPSIEFGEPGTPDQFGDIWHYAMARIANACKAFGLRARDSAYADLTNEAGFRAAAMRARALGFEGKSAIHPSQILVCNRVFSPSAEEVAWAKSVLHELERAAQRGDGAVSLNGEMVDEAHVKLASNILAEHELVIQKTQQKGSRPS